MAVMIGVRQINRKFTWAISGILVLLIATLSPILHAQSNITLTVSPPLFELSANPGDVLTNSIRLENPTDQDLKVSIDLRNFTALGEEGGVNLTPEETSYSLASWISIEPRETIVPARQTQTYNYRVDVPANAEPGGHFGSIVFKTVPEPNVPRDQSGPRVQQEIGALLLVKVSGAIIEEAAIASFGATKQYWENPPVTLETRIQNHGNVHFKPRGTITITNLFGQEIDKLALEERNVLPNSIRKLTNEWKPEGFRFGRYTASLSVVYGDDDNIITSTTTFWVAPWKPVAVVGGAILLVAFFTIHNRQRLGAALRVLRGKPD